MSDLNTTKSAFSKPENWVTWITGAAMGLGALYLLYKGLPYLDQIIEMGWYAVAAGVPLLGLIFVLLNHNVHKIVWYGWAAAMKWLTGRVIELDPIAIMERYAKHYDLIIEKIKEGVAGIRGQIQNLQRKIADGKEQIERSNSLASQAKKLLDKDPSMEKTMELQAFNAKQYEESNARLQDMLNFLNVNLDRSKQMLDTSVFNRQKLATTITIKSSERDSILALRKTISAFKLLIDGDDELDDFNRAIEIENQFVAKNLGQFEQFNDDTQGILQAGKLDKLANKSDALARIEAWDNQKIEKLKLTNSGVRVDSNITPTPAIDSSGSFDDLLDLDDKQARLRN
jgi:hypothetical protein